MVLDMHVHTSEGSLDGRVSIFDTVNKLKRKGFDGMVVTDHDSYKGYQAWSNSGRQDFTVIKGIEYDTSDAGHILVIVPISHNTDIFTLRGLRVKTLIDIVHKMDGILGPAHPYEYKRLGIANNPRWLRKMDIFKQFDFVEGFNACGDRVGNIMAQATAKRYNKQCTAGSDSHKIDCVGKARTIIDADIRTEVDLIKSIKDNRIIVSDGDYYESAIVKHRTTFGLGLYGFYAMNKVVSIAKARQRNIELMELISELG